MKDLETEAANKLPELSKSCACLKSALLWGQWDPCY